MKVDARPEPTTARGSTPRVAAIDAVRGLALVILVLVNDAGIGSAMPRQLSHPDWHGLTLADTFFPAFLFTMGAAMVFSTRATRPGAVLRRVAILFALGVAIAWLRHGEPQVQGILQKIAIAYLLAWLVLRLPARLHAPVTAAMVLGAWAAYTWVAAPGVDPGSWGQGTTLGAWFDRLIVGHPATEGPATAVLASVNVLGGALVVRGLRGLDPRRALARIGWWTIASVAVGLLIAFAVPVNKRIWTPSFIVLSHGIVCAYLAVFWWGAEVRGWRRPLDPLVALGRNPIAIYVLATVAHVALRPVRLAAMDAAVEWMPPVAASLAWSGTLTLLAIWLAVWMDRRRLYLKV